MSINLSKAIFSLLLVCTTTLISAKGTAIFFCSNFSEKKAMKWAETQKLSPITFMKYENVLLIKEQQIPIGLPNVCFTSEVRSIEKHLAFSRNEIIVRVNNGKELELLDFIQNKGEIVSKKHPFIPNQYLLKSVAENEAQLNRFIRELKVQTWVNVAQINTVHTLSATSVNDPLYERQWSIDNTGSALQGNGTAGADMQVDSAWNISTGSSNIKVVILDSGVDTLHEDLISNILPGYDGFASDTQNTFGYPTPNFSSDGHGTACAGIAAASGNNNLGVAGIAYNSKIVPIRIFYYQDYGGNIGEMPFTNSNALISGSAYAWREADGDIMSTSAGLPALFIAVLGIDKEVMEEEISEAYATGRDGKGIPMFFSSGNEGAPPVLWPGSLDNTIAIGASTMCDERKDTIDCSTESLWGSSYGQELDVVAPGVRIASTDMTGNNGYNNNNYTFTFNGTSAACPNAAGVGALILSINPNLHARDVKAILNLSADKVPGYNYDQDKEHGTWNEEVGYGRINAFEAVKLAQTYSSTVSVNEAIQKQHLNVFPNPSNGLFYIENTANEEVDIEIFNLEGKKISSFSVAQETKINKALNPGFYIIKMVKGNGEVQAKQLIVNQ